MLSFILCHLTSSWNIRFDFILSDVRLDEKVGQKGQVVPGQDSTEGPNKFQKIGKKLVFL